MSSKYCSVCGDLVSCNITPNFCYRCGNDLRQEPLTPAFKSIEERLKVIADAAAKHTPPPVEISPGEFQIRLF